MTKETNNSFEDYYAKAEAQVKQSKYPSAIPYFLQALAIAPDNALALVHNNLANAYKQNRQMDEALQHYKKALELMPNYAEAHNNLAGIYAQKGDFNQALQQYKIALHIAPDYTSAHYNLAILLLKNNQLEAAEKQFNNVLALHPGHLESQFYIGVLALEANRLQDAEKAFEAVLNLDPNHIEALCNLGVVCLKEENNQRAVDYFSKALALDNEHHEARNNLASTFMHFDRFENALMHYDVLLAKEPNNIEYLYNSGVAEMALGHLTEAIGYFDRLLKINDKHFAALSNLAAIYMRKEERDKAIDLLERAVSANPEDKASRHMLNALTQEKTGEQAETCKEYAENLFNNYALYYDEHLKKYLHYSLPNHLLSLIDSLGIGQIDSTLDLGCGTGLTGQVLRDLTKTLVGVDISGKMLAIAESKHIYDKLIREEAISYLKAAKKSYNLVVALDVLPYFGELNTLFQLIQAHLQPKGIFIFSTEIASHYPWYLQKTVRFAHHKDYLSEIAGQVGLAVLTCKDVIARHQEGKELSVYLMAVQRG